MVADFENPRKVAKKSTVFFCKHKSYSVFINESSNKCRTKLHFFNLLQSTRLLLNSTQFYLILMQLMSLL